MIEKRREKDEIAIDRHIEEAYNYHIF